MSGELREQIYNNMNLKETDELLEIWETNDHLAWTEIAFDVVKEILEERCVEIPEQGRPIYEHNEEKIQDESYELSENELKIIDDKNSPEFYDPFEVLKLSKWLEKAALASIFIVIVLGFTDLPKTRSVALAYFPNNQMLSFAATFFALSILIAGVLFSAVATYLPLRALADILRVLMEMEFNSRKPK